MKPTSRKWVTIPVEVQVRDLFSRQLVACISAIRGYQVLVGQDRVVRRLARFLPKGILYDKSIGMRRDRKVVRYHKLGFQITAFDEETPGIYGSPRHFFVGRMAADTLAMAKRWFCVSGKVQQMANEAFPGNLEKFAITGMPRTDIWRPEFRKLYEPETENIRNEFGRFILFNSNFGSVVHEAGEAFARKQYEAYMRKTNTPAHEYETLINQSFANLEAYVETVPVLLDWFGDHSIIVRPHPSESVDYWRRKFADHPRIHVIREGAVTPWILASEIVLHHGCTTGLEAELMHCKEIMYAPCPDNHHDTQLMRDCVPIAHDRQELKTMMTSLMAGETRFRKSREQLQAYFASLSGRLASDKIVDEFDAIPVPLGSLPGWLGLLRWTPRHLAARLNLRSRQARAYSRNKWQGVTLQEFTNNINKITDALGQPGSILVNEPFPGLFHLSKKPD
ncbi:MAG: hypothetical protein KDE63_12000 [Novosphingobium sp.]|nr:hypothetical protein [Novosphingobium sp.]